MNSHAATFQELEANAEKAERLKEGISEEIYGLLERIVKCAKQSEIGPDLRSFISNINRDIWDSFSDFGKAVSAFSKEGFSLSKKEAALLWILCGREKEECDDHLWVSLEQVIESERHIHNRIAQAIGNNTSLSQKAANVLPILEQLRRILEKQESALQSRDLENYFLARREEKQLGKQEFSQVLGRIMTRRQFLTLLGTGLLGAICWYCSDLINLIPSRKPRKLEIKGINYDVGTEYDPGFITREKQKPLNTQVMVQELTQIRNDLFCNSVRIYGQDWDKLREATSIALELEMTVWFSPRFISKNKKENLEKTVDYAKRVQQTWPNNRNVVLVVGNEVSLDLKGFISGNSYGDRAGNVPSMGVRRIFSFLSRDVNKYLKKMSEEVRKVYSGQITYAAGNWEEVDWEHFDIIGLNLYRDAINFAKYRALVRKYRQVGIKSGKEVAILEFNCASYKGADLKGGASYNVVHWNFQWNHQGRSGQAAVVEDVTRDELVQAEYIRDLLTIFQEEGVYATFVFTYVEPQYVFHERGRQDSIDIANWFGLTPDQLDIDRASLGIMKVYPDSQNQGNGQMVQKAAFNTIANIYQNS